jgi:hypothetical protein
MPEERCGVCGRRCRAADQPVTHTDDYDVSFSGGTCQSCVDLLSRAFAGVTDFLKQAHGERMERVLSRLLDRLEAA